MAKITKTKSGKYTTRVYTGRDPNGKQLFEYITRETWHDCNDAAREIEQDLADKTFSDERSKAFSRYADSWLELKAPPQTKPSTYKSYKMYIDTHFKPYFGNVKLSKITDMHIRRYIAQKFKDGLSSETIRKHFFILSSMLYDALKVKNPCRDIKPPQKSDYKPYVLSDEEFNLIHEAFRGTSDELPILLAAHCGMRAGEIFVLKWDDIDFEKSTIRIDEALSISEDEGYVEDDPKSARGKRTIIASDEVMTLLSSRRKSQKEIRPNIFSIRPDGYSGRFGKLINEHNAALEDPSKIKGRKGTAKYCTRNRSFTLQDKPLPDIRFHDLRHYHASTLYKHNVSDQYAADRLGHDIMVLKRIYQHLQDDSKKKEDEKVKDIYKK